MQAIVPSNKNPVILCALLFGRCLAHCYRARACAVSVNGLLVQNAQLYSTFTSSVQGSYDIHVSSARLLLQLFATLNFALDRCRSSAAAATHGPISTRTRPLAT